MSIFSDLLELREQRRTKEQQEKEKIHIPQFESQIPEDLLKNATEREKHVIQTLSVISQEIRFILGLNQEQHEELCDVRENQRRLERIVFKLLLYVMIGSVLFSLFYVIAGDSILESLRKRLGI